VRYIHSPTDLSWLGPCRGQTVRYIHSPTELLWPGAWRGRAMRYIHSPTELSWPRPRRGHPDSETHSYSHWAILTQLFSYHPALIFHLLLREFSPPLSIFYWLNILRSIIPIAGRSLCYVTQWRTDFFFCCPCALPWQQSSTSNRRNVHQTFATWRLWLDLALTPSKVRQFISAIVCPWFDIDLSPRCQHEMKSITF